MNNKITISFKNTKEEILLYSALMKIEDRGTILKKIIAKNKEIKELIEKEKKNVR